MIFLFAQDWLTVALRYWSSSRVIGTEYVWWLFNSGLLELCTIAVSWSLKSKNWYTQYGDGCTSANETHHYIITHADLIHTYNVYYYDVNHVLKSFSWAAMKFKKFEQCILNVECKCLKKIDVRSGTVHQLMVRYFSKIEDITEQYNTRYRPSPNCQIWLYFIILLYNFRYKLVRLSIKIVKIVNIGQYNKALFWEGGQFFRESLYL